MPFKVAARTLLHLGAELISSDGVALYELIKNAFDAGSRRVAIKVNRRLLPLPDQVRAALFDHELPADADAFGTLRSTVVAQVDVTAPEAEAFSSEVQRVETVAKLRKLVHEANQIVVEDWGHGMSLADLDEVYLTIGTRSRLKSVSTTGRPVLGEKGLGRLAVMRLGNYVQIASTRAEDIYWNRLEIDWSLFSHSLDTLVEDIPVSPERGAAKDAAGGSGTQITISALNEPWTEQKLAKIGEEEINRLTDPFSKKRPFPVDLSFNGRDLYPPTFDDETFNWAHASVRARLEVSGDQSNPKISLIGEVDYKHKKRVQAFSVQLPILAATANARASVLWNLGSWSMQAHWFNRQLLRAAGTMGIEIAKYVNEWSGGLMVFRDGFRVYPYGNKDDDWLDLDRKALASSGYKVNRKQIIGKVDISRSGNPLLND